MNNFDDNFNDKSLEKAIKKAKLKSIIRTTIIAVLVFIIGYILNIVVTVKLGEKDYERQEEYTEFTKPLVYISEANDDLGLLSGKRYYKLSKDVGGIKIQLEDNTSYFGIIPPMNISRVQSMRVPENEDGWNTMLWENGYRKMNFFHPDIKYKEYQNDISNLDKIDDNSIIEMAISLDKSYASKELANVAFDLKDIKFKWVWIDTYDKETINKYKNEVNEHDPKSCVIGEHEVMGVEIDNYSKESMYVKMIQFKSYYNPWIDKLKKSDNYKNVYEHLVKNNMEKSENAKILGFIVEGSKEQLKELADKQYIKASSFGVIVNKMY